MPPHAPFPPLSSSRFGCAVICKPWRRGARWRHIPYHLPQTVLSVWVFSDVVSRAASRPSSWYVILFRVTFRPHRAQHIYFGCSAMHTHHSFGTFTLVAMHFLFHAELVTCHAPSSGDVPSGRTMNGQHVVAPAFPSVVLSFSPPHAIHYFPVVNVVHRHVICSPPLPPVALLEDLSVERQA